MISSAKLTEMRNLELEDSPDWQAFDELLSLRAAVLAWHRSTGLREYAGASMDLHELAKAIEVPHDPQ